MKRLVVLVLLFSVACEQATPQPSLAPTHLAALSATPTPLATPTPHQTTTIPASAAPTSAPAVPQTQTMTPAMVTWLQ